jgi:hypothetical protein
MLHLKQMIYKELLDVSSYKQYNWKEIVVAV